MTERLTKRNSDGSVGISALRYYNYDDFQKMAKKLAHYEDLEEQGRLVVLPCKVGDTVYEICNNTYACITCEFFHEDEYAGWTSCKNENIADTDDFDGYFPDQQEYPVCEKQFMIIKEIQPDIDRIFNSRNQFGKTVFLTRDKAVAAIVRRLL